MKNDFIEYLHNYAVWTAARAAQRGFTTTKNINAAINKTYLKKLVTNYHISTPQEFDSFHKENCYTIIDYLNAKLKNTPKITKKITYGRIAKIVNVYLKTAIVIKDEGKSKLAKIVHPPIDRILLKAIPDFKYSKRKWTQMAEREYFEVINEIRKIERDSLWKIEKYWSPIV